VTILNRRNAVLGWGAWKVGKRVAKRKAKGATPSVEGGRPNKSLIAVAVASVVGALTFWRRRRSGSPSS
jgi:MYXO-CTERM domain-containing protein